MHKSAQICTFCMPHSLGCRMYSSIIRMHMATESGRFPHLSLFVPNTVVCPEHRPPKKFMFIGFFLPTIAHKRHHLAAKVPSTKGPKATNMPNSDNCRRLYTNCRSLKPPFESPHLDFPELSEATAIAEESLNCGALRVGLFLSFYIRIASSGARGAPILPTACYPMSLACLRGLGSWGPTCILLEELAALG